MIQTTITYNEIVYIVSNDKIKLNDLVLAKYNDNSIRIFKLKNKYSDLNNFYTTKSKDNVYWKIIGSYVL